MPKFIVEKGQLPPEAKRKNRKRNIVWPTFIPDDEARHGNVEISLFRGDTKREYDSYGLWVIIPEWEGALSEKGSYQLDLNTDKFVKYNERHIFHYIGNDYLVSEDVIAAQYGPDNEYRWTREPIFLVTDKDTMNTTQWEMSDDLDGRPYINAKCALTKGPSVEKYYNSPDHDRDNTQRGAWQYDPGTDGATVPEDEPATMKLIGLAQVRHGIKLEEIGTKAVCHYLGNDDERANSVGYIMEWIEPEGIMYIPFDTADSANFKVTREPSYSAAAVNGKFIQPDQNRTLEVYWMPRRWAYYYRTFETEHSTIGVGSVTITDEADCHQPVELGDEYRCDFDVYLTGPPNLDLYYDGTGNPLCSQISYEDTTCADYLYTLPVSVGLGSIITWENTLFEGTLTAEFWKLSVDASTYDGVLYPIIGEQATLHDDAFSESFWERSYSATFGGDVRRYTVDHYVGLFWASPPRGYTVPYKPGTTETLKMLGFKTGNPPDFTNRHFNSVWGGAWGDDDPSYEHDVTVYLGETEAQAIEHAVAAGYTQEEAEAHVITGYTNVGMLKMTRWFRPQPDVFDFGDNWAHFEYVNTWPASAWTAASNFLPFEGYLEAPDEDYGMFRSGCTTAFWDTYYKGYSGDPNRRKMSPLCYPRNAYDDVPAGIGLSPAIEGTLCAVIKYDTRVYYVWRKTDEEFTLRQAHISGPSFTTPLCPFEDAIPDSRYELENCFSGEGRKLTHILPPKAMVCRKANDASLNMTDEPLTDKWGCDFRPETFIEITGPGQYELEAPVYPIQSREYSGINPSGTDLFEHDRVMRGAFLEDPVRAIDEPYGDNRNRY